MALKTVNTSGTMNDLILGHLRSYGNISNVEAQAIFKCRALPRRIADLKAKGHVIQAQMKKDTTGQRYARYVYLAAPTR